MSEEERTGKRDLTYSLWHRTRSTERFLESKQAYALGMVNIDNCEYDRSTSTPLSLIEDARDVDQSHKSGTVTGKLAEMAGLPSFTMLWKPADYANPVFPQVPDIAGFRFRARGARDWTSMTPHEWAHFLWMMRCRP